MTDSTIDSGGTNACLPHQIPRSPSHRVLARQPAWVPQCRKVCDDHLAGKDRHNYGHKIMLGVLPAWLPGRLTESMVWSEDRI